LKIGPMRRLGVLPGPAGGWTGEKESEKLFRVGDSVYVQITAHPAIRCCRGRWEQGLRARRRR